MPAPRGGDDVSTPALVVPRMWSEGATGGAGADRRPRPGGPRRGSGPGTSGGAGQPRIFF